MAKSEKTKAEPVAIVTEKQLYTSVKAIEAAIKAAHKTCTDIQMEYHRIAVSVIKVLEKHRDIAVVRNLFKQMTVDLPESVRVDSMQAFFTIYAPVTFDKKTQEAKFDKKGSFNIAQAMTNPWWKAKPRQFFKPFDLQQAVNDLVQKAEKLRENPRQEEDGAIVLDIIDTQILNSLKKLVKGGNTNPKAKSETTKAKKAA